ncbi:hypothetical protein GCM10027088_45890 [Nocardia goodfellowii]
MGGSIGDGSVYEQEIGYSRAVRIGNTVAVSGTTAAFPDGQAVGGRRRAGGADQLMVPTVDDHGALGNRVPVQVPVDLGPRSEMTVPDAP